MPRDGSNIYHQPFPNVTPGLTIESAVYNGFTRDIENDMNTARPIVAGGTGATNADAALVNLSGEKAKQVVTNYDTFAFIAGSFVSAAATASPVGGHTFVGIAMAIGSTDMYLRATDLSDPNETVYTRFKQGGIWAAWKREGATAAGGVGISDPAIDMFAGLRPSSSRFVVNTENDLSGVDALSVMKTGEVYIKSDANNGHLYLQKNTTGIVDIAGLYGPSALTRWSLRLGDNTAESGGNTGSNFALYGFNDAAGAVTASMTINRASGAAAFGGALGASGALTVGGNASFSGTLTLTGLLNCNNVSCTTLTCNSATVNGNETVTGALTVTSSINTQSVFRSSIGGGATGGYYFGAGATNFSYDGTQFTLTGGVLNLYDRLQLNGISSNTPLVVTVPNGFHCKTFGTVTGTRSWSWGVYSTGVWTLIDESAGVSRIDVNTAGLVVMYAGAQVQAGGLTVSAGGIAVTTGSVALADGNVNVKKVGSTCSVNIDNTVDDSRLNFFYNAVAKWQHVSTAGSYYIYNGALSAGVFLNTQAATSWSAISDVRLKENVEPLTVLDMLSSFRAVRYTLKTTGATELGVIAQEQADQWPELIHRGTDGELKTADPIETAKDMWSANYDRFGVVALQGVKELLARVMALESELAVLKAK
jgi:hypothetical protein